MLHFIHQILFVIRKQWQETFLLLPFFMLCFIHQILFVIRKQGQETVLLFLPFFTLFHFVLVFLVLKEACACKSNFLMGNFILDNTIAFSFSLVFKYLYIIRDKSNLFYYAQSFNIF